MLAVDDIVCKTELRKIAQNHILVQQMNKNIVEEDMSFAYEEHVRQMDMLYKEVINMKK